ncbi:hypothetical protein [Cupriavidus nantongensis]|uniref:Uncharacterized protein n=1 Tax=Cupriavidus nantongensis TaxID=1796606 RepID=A0A142JHX0_9BURK|nr:hypothetical protein [Cupriavidus nantongensis]AMR77682.1 hypothetical protein A2G96_08005 [Cupriavidus nantongensis]
MKTAEQNLISIDDLDVVKASEIPFTFDLLGADDKPTGVKFSVYGDQSERVQKFIRDNLNKRRTRAAMAAKKGKDLPVDMIEDDEEFLIKSCVVRLASWEGMKEECTPENAERLFRKYPSARRQVLDQSAEAGNFMPSSRKS